MTCNAISTLVLPAAAAIRVVVSAATRRVSTVNAAVARPAGTTMVGGTDADASLLESAISNACAVRSCNVMVPTLAVPAGTVAGDNDNSNAALGEVGVPPQAGSSATSPASSRQQLRISG
jgi:hypothetical protein